jgi:uncharacterized protein Smg (DUF494 family)
MKETLIEVLIRIFDQFLEDEVIKSSASSALSEILDEVEAEQANRRGLTAEQDRLVDEYYTNFANLSSQRYLDEVEKSKLGVQGWNYLLSLENTGVLPAWVRELTLSEISISDKTEIQLSEVKSILFQIMQKLIPEHTELAWLEYNLFQTDNLPLH